MKLPYLTVLLVFLTFQSLAQNALISIGRGTDCFGRGACSISSESSNEFNSTFLNHNDGTTTLRIFRSKLTKSDEDSIFGEPITAFNKIEAKFTMEESIKIDPLLKPFTSIIQTMQLDTLSIGTYKTIITAKFIDIKLHID